MDYIVLSSKHKVPQIGFGTWEITPDLLAEETVLIALKTGYRLIDTAKIYGNERGIGEAIRKSKIDRGTLFITTKVWNDDQGFERTLKACRKSLDGLGLAYLDLYLIHWPATSKWHESWQALEELHNQGLIRAAGVSNFTIRHLEELRAFSQFQPVVNQVEFHPFIYDQQKRLLDYCIRHHILIEAYSPLHRISREHHTVINDIGTRYQKSPQQIIIRWCIQHGTLPLIRSVNPNHIRSNFDVFQFSLDDKDMESLDSLSDGERVTWDPNDMR